MIRKPPGYDKPKIRQNSQKHKYIVCYKNHYLYGDDRNCEDADWEIIGETWAVSEAQAINNVRYRNDIHHYANQFHEWDCDGMRYVEFKAFLESEFYKRRKIS